MDYISQLPVEIIEIIFSFLDKLSLWSCLSVNLYLRSIANQKRFWVTPCGFLSIDIDDIPQPQYQSSFSLCPVAKEWCDAKNRAWKWKTQKEKPLTFPFKPLCFYRSRVMFFNPQVKCVEISEIHQDGICLLHIINLTENLAPGYEIMKCVMNSKYSLVLTLSSIIIYKGYHNLDFHMAIGIDGNDVIDISNNITNYNPNNNCVFRSMRINGNILVVTLIINFNHSSPVYIVNLKTKNIIKLPIDSTEYDYVPTYEKYLVFFGYTDLFVFSLDGELLFNVGDFNAAYGGNKYFIAWRKQSNFEFFELATLRTKLSFKASNTTHPFSFAMHPYLEYFFIYDEENEKLYAYGIRSGLKLWECEIKRSSNWGENFILSHRGYIQVSFVDDESYWVNTFSIEAESGRIVPETERYDYMLFEDILAGNDKCVCDYVE